MFRSRLNRAMVIVFALAAVAFTASGVPDDEGIDAAIGWFGFLALALVFVVLVGSAAVGVLRSRSGPADRDLSNERGWTMSHLSLATVGAGCALVTVAGFLVGVVLMGSSGVAALIPETGEQGLEWIADVRDAGDIFFVGAWLVIFAGLFGLVALVGFYDALREAGPIMIVAPVTAAVGWTLVTISYVVPLAMAYELAPGYSQATGATQDALAVTADTLASGSALTNYFGEALLWGVTVPLYAVAILKTAVLSRWMGWLGLVVGVFGGWLGLLAPAWHVADVVNWIAVPAFWVFMASMGIAILRRRRRWVAEVAPAVPAGVPRMVER